MPRRASRKLQSIVHRQKSHLNSTNQVVMRLTSLLNLRQVEYEKLHLQKLDLETRLENNRATTDHYRKQADYWEKIAKTTQAVHQ